MVTKMRFLSTMIRFSHGLSSNRNIRFVSKRKFCITNSSLKNPVRPVILGIETSCDDTGAAVIDGNGHILGEQLSSQQAYSSRLGGVIPMLAQSLHETNIGRVVEKAVTRSRMRFEDLDAIAVTTKPGLVACLTVGANYALQLCRKYQKPLMPIHHMQAHALTIRIRDTADTQKIPVVDYPFLCLLVSGGHCILTWVKSVDEFLVLGEASDGAPGEAFDKVARRLKLRHIKPEYDELSGGVLIERVAKEYGGNPLGLNMPTPHGCPGPNSDCNFSFAGIKSYALDLIERLEKEKGLSPSDHLPNAADVCASFQHAICKHIGRRVERALVFLRQMKWVPSGHCPYLVISGGVASNSYLKNSLSYVAAHFDYRVACPPPRLCTDNGIMIAWNGVERFKAGIGIVTDLPDSIWVEDKSPIGPFVGDGEIRKARMEANMISKKIKLNLNFYDSTHLDKAMGYSEARLKKQEINDTRKEATGR